MDAQTIVTYLTPVIVPIVIAIKKKFLPKLPTYLLPMLAPLLGALVGYITTLATQTQGNLWLSAALGLAGVGVREIVDQLKPEVDPDKTK